MAALCPCPYTAGEAEQYENDHEVLEGGMLTGAHSDLPPKGMGACWRAAAKAEKLGG